MQLLSEYSNPFDLRSPTSPDSGAETVSDSGPEMTEEQPICLARVVENENDYSVPYELMNNLSKRVINTHFIYFYLMRTNCRRAGFSRY